MCDVEMFGFSCIDFTMDVSRSGSGIHDATLTTFESTDRRMMALIRDLCVGQSELREGDGHPRV